MVRVGGASTGIASDEKGIFVHMAPSVVPSPFRRALIAGAAVAALGGGALAATDADAAFTLGRCEGASGVAGIGASFQNTLHGQFRTLFQSSIGCEGIGTSPAAPRWQGDGSGAGRNALGARDGVRLPDYAFGGADEAPSAEEMNRMNAGPTGAASDDGQIRVIPIATGASAFIVHAPEGCSIAGVANKTNGAVGAAGGFDTTDRADTFTQRIRLTSEQVEAAFAGVAATWGDIAPGISGTATGIAGGDQTNAGTPCATVPVRRIVRQDSSGTTYGWKAYLDLIRPSRGWTTTYGADNRVWPRAATGDGVGTIVRAANGAACVGADRLCSPIDRGGGNLARLVTSTDGSIGYVDLATARSNSFHVEPAASEATRDNTYWSPLEIRPGTGAALYAEPTFHASAHFSTTAASSRGANCDTATVSDAPTTADSPGGDTTLGDWSGAFAAGGSGYPACVLTYAMAWDDSAPVYGATDAEQAKARTVKDYLELVVSSTGQTRLLASDYSPLPASLTTAAQNAVAAIDWNKRSGGGAPVDPPAPQPQPQPQPNPQPGPAPVPTPPSNQFSIPSRRTSATRLTFTVELPGAGILAVDATTKVGRKTVKVASVKTSTAAGGKVTVRLALSSAAKKALARAKSRKLAVAVKFTYTPSGGSARTVTQTVTVRAARRAARRTARRAARRAARRTARGKQKTAKR